MAIYAIESGERIKIGYSGRPLKRIQALSTSSPFCIKVLGTWNGTYETEKSVHECFSNERKNGEWFEKSDRLLRFLRRAVGTNSICIALSQEKFRRQYKEKRRTIISENDIKRAMLSLRQVKEVSA